MERRGFTLIELLVVIAIIGFLASVALINLNIARMKARDIKRLADLHQISTALNLYYHDYGYYPYFEDVGCSNNRYLYVNDPYDVGNCTEDNDNEGGLIDHTTPGREFLHVLVPDYMKMVPEDVNNFHKWGEEYFQNADGPGYAYFAHYEGKGYMLMTRLETPNHNELEVNKCIARWYYGIPQSHTYWGKYIAPGCPGDNPSINSDGLYILYSGDPE